MALTRAQLLAGDGGQGYVLPGQVQGVSQGAGVLIASNGQISVDASTVTGLVKLNSLTAFNGYVWPDVKGANGTFLSTDASGVLSWKSPAGFAVVTVSNIQPSPSDVGELWYDCRTGYLKVFQNCVDPQGWTNVAQPGLPVDPLNTSAVPAFVRGLGIIADPYECTVATVASGSSLFIVNSVTVTNLAPYQYVPIVDLNAFTNGGRFHFTNNVADASGVLKFQTVFIDQPPSLSGTNYTALIQVGYSTAYIEAFVDVINPIILLSPGSISGQPKVNAFLSYTQGTATGGLAPLNYTWVWEDDLGNNLQNGGNAYQVQPGDLGRDIFVRLTVQDSATPPSSVSGTTNIIGPIVYNPIPSSDWNPTPTDGMDTIPGGQSGIYTGPGLNITATGCIEAEVNNDGNWGPGPFPILSSQNLAIRWSMDPLCGGAPSGTQITGTLSDGLNTNEYAITVDRLPASFGFNSLSDVQPNSQHSSSTTSISNINTAAFVTLAATNTAPGPVELSKDGGSNWFVVPSAPSTSLSVNNGDNIQLRFTTGATLGQLYNAVINIGDGDNVKFTSSSPGFRVTNAINPVFPNTNFNPSGGPNAAPVTVNIPAQSLYGKATATWADSPVSTPLNTTGALLFQVNGGGYGVGPFNVINGDTVDICWDLTQVNAAANGATLTGALTDGLYANSYNLVIDRATDGYDFTDQSNQLLNTPVVSNTVNPVGFNVPIQLTYAVGTPDTLTSVLANIGATTFVAVPTSGTGLYVNPGQNIQLKATTGTNYTTPYSITTTLGAGASATDLWTVTTGSTAPLVVTPSIFSPNNGATGVATTVSVVGTAYNNQNGAGTQASSDWQIYQAIPVQPKTSSIVNVATGSGNTQVKYSRRMVGGQLLKTSSPPPFGGYPLSTNPLYSTPTGGRSGSVMLGFDGNTTTSYTSQLYVEAAPAIPATPAYTGWYPSVPITFGTSVEVWGSGVIRTVVNGTAGPDVTLTPGTWNIINIGSGNLEAVEWRSTTAVTGGITYKLININLSAIRVDGTILTDASLGQSPYSTGLVGGQRFQNASPPPFGGYPLATNPLYSVSPSGGQGNSAMLAFNGDTSTSYQVQLFVGNPPVAPAPNYSGWYPTLAIPFTTSVEVWGTGTIRSTVNGVPGPDITLTAGAWTNVNVGSGSLSAIEWKSTVASSGGILFEAININLAAIRVDGVILTDASLGQAPYSLRFAGGQTLIKPTPPPFGGPVVANNNLSYESSTGGQSNTSMLAFNGDTSTSYQVQLFADNPAPATPEVYSGWYPTLPVSFGTSVEVWGSGTVRTVVNGVAGPDFVLNSGSWTILNIGSGNLNAVEWKSTTATSGGVNYQAININLAAIRVDGVILTDRGTNPTTVLTLSNNTNLSNFAIGQTVREINSGGGVGDATGIITAINSATPSITVQTTSGTWTVGSSVEGVSSPPVDPGPPTTNPPDPTKYTAIVNVTGDTTNLTSYPLVGLSNAKTFYARVQYTSNTIITNSGFSAWSKFTTV